MMALASSTSSSTPIRAPINDPSSSVSPLELLHHGTFQLILRLFLAFFALVLLSMRLMSGRLDVAAVVPVAGVKGGGGGGEGGRGDGRGAALFVRIPKTGGEYLEELMRRHLRGRRGHGGEVRKLDCMPKREEKQEEYEKRQASLVQKVAASSPPSIWSSETIYSPKMDPSFLLFSLISDPITKFQGHFYSKRENASLASSAFAALSEEDRRREGSMEKWRGKQLGECVLRDDPECTITEGQIMSTPIRYFCGPSSDCRRFGSRWALERAKANVDQQYTLVAVFEEMERSLAKMEEVFPHLFSGLSNSHDAEEYRGSEAYIMWKRPLQEEARGKLRRMLHVEYEFYDYVKQQL